MSLDDSHGHLDLERRYSGYLVFGDVPNDVSRQLKELTKEVPFLVMSPRAIEIEYQGRDTNGVVVRALARLARLLGNADGEVRCESAGDTDQLSFEFFRIRDGRLYRQRAQVTRQSEEEVTDRP
jgi:hypothetical protein